MRREAVKTAGIMLVCGIAAGASAHVAYGLFSDEGVPTSREKVEACAAVLGGVATKAEAIPDDCRDFPFPRSYEVVTDPITSRSDVVRTYVLPSRSDFPEVASAMSASDESVGRKDDLALTAIAAAFGLVLAHAYRRETSY